MRYEDPETELRVKPSSGIYLRFTLSILSQVGIASLFLHLGLVDDVHVLGST